MIILQKLGIFIAVLSGSLMVSAPALPVAAGPFDGSLSQACRGANLSNSDTTCDKNASRDKLDSRIKFIINLLTIIVGIAAVIMIIVNGLKFITAAGDSNSISSARQGIIYALVGLIIVAFAQIIVRFVLTRI